VQCVASVLNMYNVLLSRSALMRMLTIYQVKSLISARALYIEALRLNPRVGLW
jgi:hypothetical protein